MYENRSYRRFHQDVPISQAVLRQLVDLARLSPSGANKQPLKYLLVNDAEKNAAVFEMLGWAGYLTDWDGPDEGERPSAEAAAAGETPETRVLVRTGGLVETVLPVAEPFGSGVVPAVHSWAEAGSEILQSIENCCPQTVRRDHSPARKRRSPAHLLTRRS